MPSDEGGGKTYTAPPVTPPPGPYGSESYYSTESEEAELAAVTDLAQSLSAVGSARIGEHTMLIRVPPGSSADYTIQVASFEVKVKTSQFTIRSVDKLTKKIARSVEDETPRQTAVGFSDDAVSDRVDVEGAMSSAFERRWAEDEARIQ